MQTTPLVESSGISDAPRARVIRSLKQWIDDGVLPPGQVLPPERTLAETLNVNRGTVRRALAALDDEGILRSNGGRTRIVAAPRPRTSSFMGEAIAVITPFLVKPTVERQSGGLLEYISQGVLWATQNSGRHAIALHPTRLDEFEISRLCGEQPLGVLVPDTKMNFARTVEVADKFRRAGVRVVVYGGSPELADFDRVASDHEEGAYQLARWLIEQGRRSILPVWSAPADGYWFPQRIAGYRRACEESGLTPLEPLVVPPFPICAGDKSLFESGARHWLGYLFEHLNGPKPVDALMMGTDTDVFGAAASCRLLGKIPNQDVALVGYDNYWADCPEREFEPIAPLATVDKSNFEVGETLVQLLLERVDGRLPATPQQRNVPPQMRVIAQ